MTATDIVRWSDFDVKPVWRPRALQAFAHEPVRGAEGFRASPPAQGCAVGERKGKGAKRREKGVIRGALSFGALFFARTKKSHPGSGAEHP